VVIKAGLKIFNKDKRLDSDGDIVYGTIGGIVYDYNTNEQLIITCFHSVIAKDTLPKEWKNNCKTVCTESDKRIIEIGEIIDADFNEDVDIALIKPHPALSVNTQIENIGIPRDYVTTYELIKDTSRLQKYGAKTQYKIGVYAGVDNSEEISYYQMGKHELRGLLKVKDIGRKDFAQGGDSGSLVLDLDRHVIGVMVAKNSEVCFLIRASYITANFNIKFVR
jgi:hypothetical protein